MVSDPRRAHVLIITDEPEAAERLSRWVSSAGALPVALAGAEKFLFRAGDDERIDLLVVDLDTDVPAARELLARLSRGELFAGVPQLHLLRDAARWRRLVELDPAAASISMMAPPDAREFQARVRLAAEVGYLRRQLVRSSMRDELTGLYNERFVLLRLEQEFSRALRHRTPLSLVLFQIDGLDSLDERRGRAFADGLILEVSHLLRAQVRKEDAYGRLGRKSFAVVLPGIRPRGAAVFANKLRGEAEHGLVPEGEPALKLSAGIASYLRARQGLADSGDLLRAAQGALAEADQRGGNRVYIDPAALRSQRPLIVIADSDPELLHLAEDLLSMDDYRVVAVESVRTLGEALRYRRPDLLIIDLGMGPTGAGNSWIAEIRAMFKADHPPILGLAQGPQPAGERSIHPPSTST